MGIYSDILITADYDRTITGPKGEVPQRNVEAIRHFIDNGGHFTVNTGRSLPNASVCIQNVPMNAPILLYNGSLAMDGEKTVFSHEIVLPMEETLLAVCRAFPELSVSLQGLQAHYDFQSHGLWKTYLHEENTIHQRARAGVEYGPFIKFNVYHYNEGEIQAQMFTGTPEEIALMDRAEAWILEHYKDTLSVFRSGARLLNVHAAGVSKLAGARQLQQLLGKKILICIGDEGNDVSMLEGADYAFCPADGKVADQFPNVCPCGEGAVADVVYNRIPEILKGLK